MGRRYLNKKSNTYVTKGKNGKFTKNVSIKRSQRADKRVKAKHRPKKRGYRDGEDYANWFFYGY